MTATVAFKWNEKRRRLSPIQQRQSKLNTLIEAVHPKLFFRTEKRQILEIFTPYNFRLRLSITKRHQNMQWKKVQLHVSLTGYSNGAHKVRVANSWGKTAQTKILCPSTTRHWTGLRCQLSGFGEGPTGCSSSPTVLSFQDPLSVLRAFCNYFCVSSLQM